MLLTLGTVSLVYCNTLFTLHARYLRVPLEVGFPYLESKETVNINIYFPLTGKQRGGGGGGGEGKEQTEIITARFMFDWHILGYFVSDSINISNMRKSVSLEFANTDETTVSYSRIHSNCDDPIHKFMFRFGVLVMLHCHSNLLGQSFPCLFCQVTALGK